MKRRAFLASPVALLTIPAWAASTLTAFGDSITLAMAGGASSPDKGYAALVAAGKGFSLDNQGVRGAEIADIADRAMRYAISDDSLSIGLFGFNDNFLRGLPGLAPFKEAFEATAAWLCIPESNKLRAQSPAISYAGNWANVGAYGGTVGRVTTGTGDTATINLSGPVIYLCFLRFADGTGKSVDIKIDGVSYCPISTDGGSLTYLGLRYAPMLVRIEGLTDAPHEIVLTAGSGWGAGFLWAAAPKASQARLYAGNCLHMNSIGYGMGSAGASSQTADVYSAMILDAINVLRSDGLGVVYVDASSVYDPTIDVAADNTHPDDAGHAKIANAYLAKMV